MNNEALEITEWGTFSSNVIHSLTISLAIRTQTNDTQVHRSFFPPSLSLRVLHEQHTKYVSNMDVIVIISIVFATYSRMLEHTTTVYLMRVVFSDV